METDKDITEAIADRLKNELNIEVQQMPGDIVEKLFALKAAEDAR